MDDSRTLTREEDPPLLTGGLSLYKNLTGVSVDYLTVTIPSRLSSRLLRRTKLEREGGYSEGFNQSELRLCEDGKVWRRFDPRESSNDYGREYESWKYNGPQATPAARYLRRLDDVRPTYVDVAFDFGCRPGDTSDALLEGCREWYQGRGLSDGINGNTRPDGQTDNTRYVGSRSSERRIKIYRKDLRSEAFGAMHGPTLRVEITLKNQHARRWWAMLTDYGFDRAYAVAAAHIQDMSGMECHFGIDDVPELVQPPQSPAAEQLCNTLRQCSGTLRAALESGIDVLDLVHCMTDAAGDRTAARIAAKKREFDAVGPREIEDICRLLIQYTGNRNA